MARPEHSLAEIAALLAPDARARLLDAVPAAALERLAYHWPFWERPGQRPPPPPWRVWLVMAGRGFGKTRIGAEWVRALAESKPGQRLALVAATQRDARRVMVEGESGLLAIAPPDRRPAWEPSLGRLAWPNGTQAFVYSAAEAESLRGGQHHAAWADEIAKWEQEEAWDNLMLSLRLGRTPRIVATTTPRPVPLIRRLVGAADVAITHGRTRDNRAHLSADFLRQVTQDYAGTRLGRQELDGELIEEVAGALWTRALIEACRAPAPAAFSRIVVGVDPPAGVGGDACGIVAVGLAADGHGYVIEDASIAGAQPDGWARAVAACAQRHGADRVVAEANNGGAMVRGILHAADARLPLALVHASQGKAARAEPIAILYEAGRVHHAGAFAALEDELCGLMAGGGYAGPGRSPDRADALVWALTELMLAPRARAGMRWL
ncbi:MAG: ATP-binding protein [Proteobacteria bacterium SG_bin5]|nr:MAG: ATP-binding protein [Proteobacteria bacterium SG_bin5]